MHRYNDQSELDKVRTLLEATWNAVIQTFPWELQIKAFDMLRSESVESYSVTKRDFYEQADAIATQRANIDLSDPYSVWYTRVPCLFCGAEYKPGEGMMRHLSGYGRVIPCGITEALHEYVFFCRAQQFREAGAAKRKADADRRAVEPLFEIGPGELRQLEEGVWSRTRTPEEIAFAERRLADLGFIAHRTGNEVRYELTMPDIRVFADPRVAGRIDFKVYRAQGARGGRRRQARPNYASFSMLDSWKNDLAKKLSKRIEAAIGQLH
jgi:hypothetical protein